MYISTNMVMNYEAGTIHWLHHTSPNAQVCEQEQRDWAILVRLGDASMDANEKCHSGTIPYRVALIRASWYAFWYNQALRIYVWRHRAHVDQQALGRLMQSGRKHIEQIKQGIGCP